MLHSLKEPQKKNYPIKNNNPMTPEQIAQQKSQLIDDIMNWHSSPQTRLLAIDALWALAKVEGMKEAMSKLTEKQKEPNY